MANVDNPIWDIVDSPCQDEWEQESGQVVYNKRQNWKSSPPLPFRVNRQTINVGELLLKKFRIIFSIIKRR